MVLPSVRNPKCFRVGFASLSASCLLPPELRRVPWQKLAANFSSLPPRLSGKVHWTHAGKTAPTPKHEQSRMAALTARCSPRSTCGASKTVRRVWAACLVSLLALMGNISLELNTTLDSRRNIEKALASFCSSPTLLVLHLMGFLQEEGKHPCCWGERAGESKGLGNTHVLEKLAALCEEAREKIQGMNPQCEEEAALECQVFIANIRQKLNSTHAPQRVLVRSRIISELLEMLESPEEDLKATKSNPSWVDVATLRLILRIKGAILNSLETFLSPEDFQALWRQMSAILTYYTFASENVQECWMENPNLSITSIHHEGTPVFNTPSLSFPPHGGFLTALESLLTALESLQACMLEQSPKKLIKKSKDVLSLVSLQVSLLLVAGLIYPVVLVSFKEMTDWIQNYAQSLKERTEDLKQERCLAEDLLHQMLPKSVAKQLRKKKHVEAENYDQVTIFFSDVVGFTSIAASCTPLEVVEMLNNLYVCFDTRIESYDVYKVETIGDAYMVVSGLPERNGAKHAHEIAKMALDLVAAVRQVVIPHMPSNKLQLRAGIHTGPCVAGVVGYKMPRYCLFGDTVNTASRMESTSLPQKIHISSATFLALLEEDAYDIELRGETEVKGKGKMNTYWLLGNKNYSVQNDSLVCHWNPGMARKKATESSPLSAHQSSTGTVGTPKSKKTDFGTREQMDSIGRGGTKPSLTGSAASEENRDSGPGFQDQFKTSHFLSSGPPSPHLEERCPDLLDHQHCPESRSSALDRMGFLPGSVGSV